MTYHLHSQGQNLGVFPLDELRRRRGLGELSGAEWAWCEGMADWQLLDAVLASQGSGSPTTLPPPLPVTVPPGRRTRTRWLVGMAVLVFLLGSVGVGVVTVRVLQQMQEVRHAVTSGDEGVIEASKAVVVDSDSKTERHVRKRSREFRIYQWLEGYQQRGDHGADCDAVATNLIAVWIETNFGIPPANGPSLEEMSDQVASATGCNDPLVLTVSAVNAEHLHEKASRLERALAGFQGSRHLAYPRLYAAVLLMKQAEGNTQRRNSFFPAAYKAFTECFNDGSFRPEDQAEIAEIFIHDWGQGLVNHTPQGYLAARAAGPGFEWLALVMEGEYHLTQAWKARGGGYADSVTEEGWKGFHTHMSAARTNLTAAWKLRADLPLAPCRMIYVAMGQSDGSEMRLWFDRTLAAQIDYPEAWTQMRWGLRPRWHGSLDAMLALGKLAVDTKRFDTDVPRKLFDVVMDLESELQVSHGQHLFARDDIWPLFQRMYKGYLAEPSQLDTRAGWHSAYAVVAYLAGQYEVAKTELEAVRWAPPARHLGGWGNDLSLMPLEVAARTGPLASRIREAESAHTRMEVEDALRLYRDLKDAADADSRTQQFIQHRLATLELEKQLSTGAWIDLAPQLENDPAWVIVNGKVRRLPDGVLEVEGDGEGHLLYSRARLRANVEIKGEIEFVKSSNGAFQAGFVLGLPNLNDSDWFGIRLKINEVDHEAIVFGRAWGARPITLPIPLKPDRNSFQFRFQKGLPSVSLNGREVFSVTELPWAMRFTTKDVFAGLGAYNDMNQTTVRYHNVQVRQLPSKP